MPWYPAVKVQGVNYVCTMIRAWKFLESKTMITTEVNKDAFFSWKRVVICINVIDYILFTQASLYCLIETIMQFNAIQTVQFSNVSKRLMLSYFILENCIKLIFLLPKKCNFICSLIVWEIFTLNSQQMLLLNFLQDKKTQISFLTVHQLEFESVTSKITIWKSAYFLHRVFLSLTYLK